MGSPPQGAAGAGGGATAAQVWAFVARTLTDPASYMADVSLLATAASIAALNDLSAAQVLTQIQIESGLFSGQVNLQTLLAALGIPDVAGKPLYTVLVTDRWDTRLSAVRAAFIDNVNNVNLATLPAISAARIGYLDNINNANLSTIPAISAARIGYLDNINNANLATIPDISTIISAYLAHATHGLAALDADLTTIDTVVDAIKLETDQLSNHRFDDKLPSTPTVDAEADAAEVDLTAGSVTPTFPAGATRQRVMLLAFLHVANKAAAPHHIGLTLQIQKNGGGYGDVVDLTANPPVSLVNVDGDTSTFSLAVDVTATVDTSAVQYDFRWQADSDNAGAVNYTSNFVLVMTYSM